MPNHDDTNQSNTALRQTHTATQIHKRLERGPSHRYLKDFIYGGIDGAVTTFAVVSGVAGADLNPNIVVILGIANLIGDGFSMAAGNFLGTRAERQQWDRLRQLEYEHIERIPSGEREEVAQILHRQGFTGADLERAVEIITSDKQRWVELMLKEEHGMSGALPIAWKAALATFVAFVVVGSLPLLPFLMAFVTATTTATAFQVSLILTSLSFFGIGAVKSLVVNQAWYWSGLETLLVGGIASALAYGCGHLISLFF